MSPLLRCVVVIVTLAVTLCAAEQSALMRMAERQDEGAAGEEVCDCQCVAATSPPDTTTTAATSTATTTTAEPQTTTTTASTAAPTTPKKVATEPPIRKGWKPAGTRGMCYHAPSKTAVAQGKAAKTCADLDSKLATFVDAAEYNMIKQEAGGAAVWVDGKHVSNVEWQWADGTKFNAFVGAKWLAGEPDERLDAAQTCMAVAGGGTRADKCDARANFACMYKCGEAKAAGAVQPATKAGYFAAGTRGKCFKVLNTQAKPTWANSAAVCAEDGAQLAAIADAAEWDRVWQDMSQMATLPMKSAWIDGSKGLDGVWRFAKGADVAWNDALAKQLWQPGHPIVGHNCAQIGPDLRPGGQTELHSQNCNYPLNVPVCMYQCAESKQVPGNKKPAVRPLYFKAGTRGMCFKVVNLAAKVPYAKAPSICAEDGAQLANVADMAEWDAIWADMAKRAATEAWIDGKRAGVGAKWAHTQAADVAWDDGLAKQLWQPGHPLPWAGYDCAQIGPDLRPGGHTELHSQNCAVYNNIPICMYKCG